MVRVGRPADGFLTFFIESRDFRSQQPCLLEQALVNLAGFGQFLIVIARQYIVAHEVEQKRVEHLESVWVVDELSQQHVVFNKKLIVVASLNKEKAVL